MRRALAKAAGAFLLLAGGALALAAQPDFTLTAPDGRRVLLKDDGTWRYMETDDGLSADEKEQAVLVLERRTDRPNGCQFGVQLTNNLPYAIRTLVLHYSAYRENGIIYDTVAARSAFAALRPGDSQARQVDFTGIACRDIARLQVVGGDRCEMGELHRFTDGKGMCLARVRVVESKLVRFDK